MRVKIRKSNNKDIDKIYNLQCNCFTKDDAWYRSTIGNNVKNGFVVETEDNEIIGVLLQGNITPCDRINNFMQSTNYKNDIFEPITENGHIFFNNNSHYEKIYGIVLICVDENYRGRGLASKLIQKHFDVNKGEVVCLNTRYSNISAQRVYEKMGYEHIANIKNKYFLPDEDSCFMIKNLTE
jgi:ribosomal protein S18 acetylase RimI-like enzyme